MAPSVRTTMASNTRMVDHVCASLNTRNKRNCKAENNMVQISALQFVLILRLTEKNCHKKFIIID